MASPMVLESSIQVESSDSDREHVGLPPLARRRSNAKNNQPQDHPSSSSSPMSTPSQQDPDSSSSNSVTGPTDPNPTRHADFWFRDGSIILQVQSKLFKIHQTILANHSEVFSGLFDVPPPPPPASGDQGFEGDQMLEGCRIVVLNGDSEKDMEDLLRAVYNPSYFEDNLSPTADMDAILAFVSGILRLSTKYLVRSLRVRCIGILASRLPATFEEYNIRSSGSSSKSSSSSRRHHPPSQQPSHFASSISLQSSYTSYASSSSPSHSTEVTVTKQRFKSDTIMRSIALAHETNVLQILPYLYYCASRISLHRLLKDREGDISWRLKSILLAGRERLRYAELSLSYSFLCVFRRAPQCKGGISCAHTRGPENEWRMVQCAKAPNPMRLYTGWDRLGVCRECVDFNKGLHEAGRREVWERLPGLFELPKWEELWRLQSM